MSSDVLIRLSGVSKKFTTTLNKSMWYGALDLGRAALGLQPPRGRLRPGEFWAVRDVSFTVRRGECVGLIGPNGAGKSTLLKLLNGIIIPDAGSVEMLGRVGALLEIGAGFHPLLTGRENIYINGAIMGLARREIDERLDSIIEFAELGAFIDTPVSYYSSGMYVRLGFAIAAHLKPDVLLIDEVLAVGDVGFRAKCYNYIAGFMQSCAVILVSHSMPHIDRYCQKSVLMLKGRAEAYERTPAVIERYYRAFEGERTSIIESAGNRLLRFELLDEQGNPVAALAHGSLLRIRLQVMLENRVSAPIVQLSFLNRELQVIAISRSAPHAVRSLPGQPLSLQADIQPLILHTGAYKISLLVFDSSGQEHLLWHNAAWDLQVTGPMLNYGSAAVYFDATWTQVL